MKEFYGKQIPSELVEIIAPEHTALVIVDMQNDFCKEQPPTGEELLLYPSLETTIANIRTLLTEAHRMGVLVVYVQHTTLPEFQNESPARIFGRMYSRKLTDPYDLKMYTLEGSWGWQVMEELRPAPSDKYLQIRKPRPSAFIATNFDLLLRNCGIKTLIMTGVVTEGCVESTTRDALHFDYFTVTVKDGVDSDDKEDHFASLRHAAKKHPVLPAVELIELWQKHFSPP